ncbi:E3 ubiquitin-protein ligase PUB24 [Linum perenne]
MKDPVTAITGITYDRESIEHWIFNRRNTTCPVTKQPLLSDDLTPNHTLRRLIQSWCTCHGLDRIPTPRPLLDRSRVMKLLGSISSDRLVVLRQLEALASEHERNRKHLVDAGVPRAMFEIVLESFDSGDVDVVGLEEAVRVLRLVRVGSTEGKLAFARNERVIESLTWLMGFKDHVSIRCNAISVMRLLLEEAGPTILERLRPCFFKTVVGFLKDRPFTNKD